MKPNEANGRMEEKESGPPGERVPDSFQLVFRQHYPTVVRKLHALVGDHTAAEDLAQEVFVRLYRSPPERLDAAGAWLHRTLTRMAYDYLRSRLSRENLLEREQHRLRTEAAAYPSNEDLAILNWEKDVVRQVLQKLSERDRTALLLREEGYTYEEIGKRLNVKPKIVGPMLARAADRLRKKIGHEEAVRDDER